MKITEHFTLEELTASQVAKRKGIDNTPNDEVMANLKVLCENVLEPLRASWGSAIIVTSGYRCEKLNRAVKGAKNSQHTKGMAADIKPANGDTLGLLRRVMDCGFQYDQLINEYPDAAGCPSWVHISYRNDGANRHQYLVVR